MDVKRTDLDYCPTHGVVVIGHRCDCAHPHATKDGVHCDDCGVDVEFVSDDYEPSACPTCGSSHEHTKRELKACLSQLGTYAGRDPETGAYR